MCFFSIFLVVCLRVCFLFLPERWIKVYNYITWQRHSCRHWRPTLLGPAISRADYMLADTNVTYSFNHNCQTAGVHTPHLTALCPGLPGWAGTRKVKPIWILLKQETGVHMRIKQYVGPAMWKSINIITQHSNDTACWLRVATEKTADMMVTPPPVGERSIVISVSVCVSVCLCVGQCVFVCPRSHLRNCTFDL